MQNLRLYSNSSRNASSLCFPRRLLKATFGKTSRLWHPHLNCSVSKPASALRKSPNTDKAEELSPENNSESTSEMLQTSLCEPETGVDMASVLPWLSVIYMALVVFLFLHPCIDTLKVKATS